MSDLDIVIIAVWVIFTILGIYWGLIRQGLALAGLVVGLVVAGRYSSEIAAWLSSFIADDTLSGVLGFLLVLGGVSLSTSLIASLLRIFVGLLFLGWLDHLLGGLLGLLQGVLASAIVLVAMVTFPLPLWENALAESRLVEPLLWVGQPLAMLLPEIFQAAVQTALNR